MDEGVKIRDPDASLPSEDRPASGNNKRPPHRRFWLALALLIFFGMVAWFCWARAHRAPPQIITLPNGERYQFAGVTYGTNNVPPYFPARLVRWLPKKLADPVRKLFGARVSQAGLGQKVDTLRLFVWFRHLESNGPVTGKFSPPIVRARLADQSGLEAGVTGHASFSTNVAWTYAEFTVVPRRSRMLQCNFYPLNTTGITLASLGSVTFRNPAFARFPQWQPEPVPAVKQAGDLEVRLDDFTAGRLAGGFPPNRSIASTGSSYLPLKPGEESSTWFNISANSKGTNHESWVLHRAELSDATGNVLRGNLPHPIPTRPDDNGRRGVLTARGYSDFISGAFWPDESAWRLNVEVKRIDGFAPEDMVTFKNVPVPVVGTTNVPRLTNNIGGIQIILTHFRRLPFNLPITGGISANPSEVQFELAGKMTGVAVDLLSVTSDAGRVESSGPSGSDKSCAILLTSIPTNAQTVTFTFVVQKTRSVEFLVKPPKPD